MRNNLLQMSAINTVPFLLSVFFIRIRAVTAKSFFLEGLVKATLHCVGQASPQIANLDISLRVWNWRWSLLRPFNNSNNQMSGLLVPSKPLERWTAFGANHLPILCEAPHIPHNKYGGPTFILVNQFTPKIKLITFLNEWEKNFASDIGSSAHKTCNRRYQDDLNTSLTLWKYNKHNPFTQNTSLRLTHGTCNLSQCSLPHH